MKRVLQLSFFLFIGQRFFIFGAFAQELCKLSLSGKVIDTETKEKIPFADIYIEELKTGTTSDFDGNYTLKGLCPGYYTVICRHLSCIPKEIKLNITADLQQDFSLPHSTYDLQEVQVNATRGEEKISQSKTSIQGRDLENMQGQSLGDALKFVSGVTTLNTGSNIAKPMIQGVQGNRVLILNNGTRQEGQQWGSEHAPELDPFIAGQITVIKGASTVRYGADAIGGVILIDPAPLRDSAGISGKANSMFFSNGRQYSNSAMLEGQLKKTPGLSWRLQGTYRRGGNMKTPGYYLDNTGLKELNFSEAIRYKRKNWGLELFYSQFNSELGIYSGSHIGNLSDLQRILNGEKQPGDARFSYAIKRPYQQVSHELVKLKGWLYTGEKGKLIFSAARQFNRRQEYDKHRPYKDSLAALDRPELNFGITTYSGDLVWEHDPLTSIHGSLGVSVLDQANTWQGRFLLPNYTNRGGGVFLIERWTRNSLQIEAGIRQEFRHLESFFNKRDSIYNLKREFSNLSLSTGLIWTASENLQMAANFSSAYRPPSPNELYTNGLHHGAAVIEVGNTNLEVEKVKCFSLSLDYNSSLLSFQGVVYHNSYDSFIYQEPQGTQLTISGAFPVFYYRQTNASISGLDISVNYNLHRNWFIFSKGSMLVGKNKQTGKYLYQMPAPRADLNLRHTLKDFKWLHSSYLSAGVLAVNRNKWVDTEHDFSAPPAGYLLLNAEIGGTIHLQKTHINWSISATNLLNTTYRDYLNRFRYYANEVGRNVGLRLVLPF